jgi:hypothetical protein
VQILVLQDLPYYGRDDVEMDNEFLKELRTIVRARSQRTVLKRLRKFITRWSLFWQLDKGWPGDRHPGICDRITKLQITRQDIRRLRMVLEDKRFWVRDSDEVAIHIAIPPAMLMARVAANKYQVPFWVALHQMFCPGPHDNCF